jgi:translocation and assembly module TamA
MTNVSREFISYAAKCGATCLLFMAFVFSVTVAQAFDVRLIAPEKDGITKTIETSSLTFIAKNEDIANVQDIVAAARADYGQILSTLYRNGYYSGTISIRIDGREAADMSPFTTPSAVRQIVIQVDPGRIFKFGAVGLAPRAPDTELPAGFVTGEPAQSTVIAKATNAAIGAWRTAGHAKAEVSDQQISANHNDNTLDANIRLKPGPVVHFGKLNIVNDGNVKEARIREIAGFPKGKVFSPEAMNTVADRLRETGSFAATRQCCACGCRSDR